MTFVVMAATILVGLVESLALFERIGGGHVAPEADLDRLVRESW
jgi:hypothetical protein